MIQLDPGEPGSRVRALYLQFRDAILAGKLSLGELLPPSRTLAIELSVSRGTVTQAYDRLAAEGLVDSLAGSGTRVSGHLQLRGPRHPSPGHDAEAVPPPAGWERFALPPDPLEGTTPAFDFRQGYPDPLLFPLEAWRSCLQAQYRSTAVLAADPDPQGDPGLREALAGHLLSSRGLAVAPEEIVVTRGARQAFELLGRILLGPGRTAAVEDPGYGAAALAFRGSGARVAYCAVDGDGLVVAGLPAACGLVHVTPSHQAPLGTVLSLPRRLELLEWAARAGAVVVEDDYDSEYRFGSRALEPLRSVDQDGRVVYVGTLSKSLSPSLRLGFLVAPPTLRHAVVTLKQLGDPGGDTAAQRALAQLILDGRFGAHLRRSAKVYGARRMALIGSLEARLPDLLTPISGAAGLHLTARLSGNTSIQALDAALRRAAADGVAVRPLHRFAHTSPERQLGLVLGYGLIPEDRIDDGVERLSTALRRT